MINFEKDLNKVQLQAVRYNDGPALVIAGAGSGKTRVLTYKIAYLLEQGYKPENLMALTFTNKAAKEMKDRISSMVSFEEANPLKLGTFHSIFCKILRKNAPLLDFKSNFSILEPSQTISILKRIIEEQNLDKHLYPPKNISKKISNLKNKNISPEQYSRSSELILEDTRMGMKDFHILYKEYLSQCKVANCMDFDDLLFLFNSLLDSHPQVLKTLQENIKFLLIDEFQDTNPLQYEIAKKIVAKNNKIFVVGDDSQSIYAFRGADINNILSFRRHFPKSEMFILNENYRSTQNIVNISNHLIRKNTTRINKVLVSNNDIGKKISLYEFADGIEEANSIVEFIEDSKKKNSEEKYSSFAILYRTNAQSRLFEEAFLKRGIPYHIYGGLSFYQRAEIKDILSYLILIHNPENNEAFIRAAKYPAKGIGAKTLKILQEYSNKHQCSLFSTCLLLNDEKEEISHLIQKKGKKSIIDFIHLILSLKEDMQTNFFSWVHSVIKKSNILKELEKDKQNNSEEKLKNVVEFLSITQDFYQNSLDTSNEEQEKISNTRESMLSLFLEGITLATDQIDENSKKNKDQSVHLMTIHAAKGLEYKYVYIVGLEEGLFPSIPTILNSRRENETELLEEERRLLYVAITRAQKECSLSLAKRRMIFGAFKEFQPSSFIKDLDPSLINFFGVVNFYENKAEKILYEAQYKKPTANNTNLTKSFRPLPQPNKQNLNNSVLFNNKDSVLIKDASEIKIGDKISHKIFGIGIISNIDGEKDNAILEINFEDGTTKSIILRFAFLKKII